MICYWFLVCKAMFAIIAKPTSNKELDIKGFVLALTKGKNEDMIALILTKDEVRSYYRFFGARHSILQVGHLIDFEVEGEGGHFLPRLRNLSHIGFPWLFENNRLLVWHNFIKLFVPHLQDTSEVDSFYFNLLLDGAKRWHKQNPKRIVCELYLMLLSHEGRLHWPQRCYICEEELATTIALMRSFLPVHPACISAPALLRDKLEEYYKTTKTINLEDHEVACLYDTILKGL